jgi:molybdopterin converting factor small subunit
MNENEEVTILHQSNDLETIEANQRAEYDIQIATAKRYPRNLPRVKENCLAIVTMDKSIAESCRYTLPRDGKSLSGPSVHLARIIVQAYGNVRAEARVKQITDKQVISEAVVFDLETNYACKIEVRRSIVTKAGKRYSDDMIVVTGNAANAVAFRNAVFSVIPKGLTDICYDAAIRTITGDLSSEDKLVKARNTAVEYLKTTYNVTEEQILKALGLRSVNQIKAEQIADIKGLIQAIKDGDTTVEQVFLHEAKKDPETVKEKKDKIKDSKTEKPELF